MIGPTVIELREIEPPHANILKFTIRGDILVDNLLLDNCRCRIITVFQLYIQIFMFCTCQMSLDQSAWNSGYGSVIDYLLQGMHSRGENLGGRKSGANDPSYINRFSFKTSESIAGFWELGEVEKCTTAADSVIQIKEQYNATTREIGIKLIALADAFDAEFFGNLDISKKYT